jgi:hypothetical protein
VESITDAWRHWAKEALKLSGEERSVEAYFAHFGSAERNRFGGKSTRVFRVLIFSE